MSVRTLTPGRRVDPASIGMEEPPLVVQHEPWGEEPVWEPPAVGSLVTIVKADSGGEEVTRYEGRVLDRQLPALWIAVEATWTHRPVLADGLLFATGDRLIECFSPRHPFNTFAIHAPDGELRGWYANVTYPTRLEGGSPRPVLTWRDLYLDLIVLPDGSMFLRDEDELGEAGLEGTNPALASAIGQAMANLLWRANYGVCPFVRHRRHSRS